MSTNPTVSVALRKWDHAVPAMLGEVTADEFDLRIVGRDRMVTMGHADWDVVEASLSKYIQARAVGRDDIIAVPHFVMRGFRHRCVLTREHSDLVMLEQLKGAAVGLSGWAASGNVWTKAAIRHSGVDIRDVAWHFGRLTDADAPVRDDAATAPGDLITRIRPDQSLMSMLLSGELDALMTAFPPPGLIAGGSGIRHLIPNYVDAEIDYFNAVGFVPGIHVLTAPRALHERHPALLPAVSEVLTESARIWAERRAKHVDTTPWLIDDLERAARVLPPGWDAHGLEPNRAMLATLLDDLTAQHIIASPPDLDDLFFGVDL